MVVSTRRACPIDSAVAASLGTTLGQAKNKRLTKIEQRGNELVVVLRGRPVALRWADTGTKLRPGELPAGTKVNICPDTGRVSRPAPGTTPEQDGTVDPTPRLP